MEKNISGIKTMKYIPLHIMIACKNTFRVPLLRWLFGVLWILFFIGMFVIPLRAIPGNTVLLQATLYRVADYMILIILSALSALTVAMQINIFQQGIRQKTTSMLFGGIGITSSITSSIFASATCGLCLSAFFSFLGFHTILFLVEYRWYLLMTAALLLICSLYFSAKRLNEGCRACIS